LKRGALTGGGKRKKKNLFGGEKKQNFLVGGGRVLAQRYGKRGVGGPRRE